MSQFSRDQLVKMISLRVTTEQNRLLEEMATHLDLGGKAEVLRKALDFWLENADEAKQAMKAAGKGKARD